jgi:hypothetical protein
MPKKQNSVPKVLCPAPSCRGGYEPQLRKATDEEIAAVPPEVFKRKKAEQLVYRCIYCQFMWAQNPSRKIGTGVAPLGFYKNFVFEQVSENYETRGDW